jgi:hypothetical protein
MQEKQYINLMNKDSDVLVIFLSANNCTKCIEHICGELENIISQKHKVIVHMMIRMSNSPIHRRALMDKLNLSEEAMASVHFFFDIENETSVGIETRAQVKGNFRKYEMYRTPGIIYTARSKPGKIRVLHYDQLFRPDTTPLVSLQKLLTH